MGENIKECDKYSIQILNPQEECRLSAKGELINIRKKYINKPLTKLMRESIYNELCMWKKKWDIEDFQFTLVNEGTNSISISPTRKIDKYILIGIIYVAGNELT